MNSIFTRRSVRKYSGREVEDEKLDRILRAAMQAPSAVNQQPWEFIVIKNKETLKKLADISIYATMLKEASAAVIILGNKDMMIVPEKASQDLSAATENLMLEAVELGLGTVWIGVDPDVDKIEFITKMFDVPENVKPYSLISIGYPADENANKFVDRYKAERVHYEKY